MVRKLYKENAGAAAAEFAFSLLILVPLLLWTIRLGELLNVHHTSLEAARTAAWERAYGGREADIKTLVENTVKKGAIFSNQSNINITTTFSRESSQDDYNIVSFSGVPERLGLLYQNYHKVRVVIEGQLPMGIDYSLQKSHILLTDPWNLTDQNNDRRITSEEDLEPVVYKLYFYDPISGGVASDLVNWGLDFFDSIEGFLGPILWLTGNELDIDPRGHPTLEHVPQPSGGN